MKMKYTYNELIGSQYFEREEEGVCLPRDVSQFCRNAPRHVRHRYLGKRRARDIRGASMLKIIDVYKLST